jgi:hypothetical protein
MSVSSLPHIGFVDGTSRSTQNLASAAWEIYAPTNELISLHSVFLGRATNNITEYSASHRIVDRRYFTWNLSPGCMA